MTTVIYKTRYKTEQAKLFDWHCHPDALPAMIPPWEPVTVESFTGRLPEKDSTVVMRIDLIPGIPLYWVARHTDFQRPSHFVDIQEKGPFVAWQHTHRFVDNGDGTTTLEDDITYQVPLGPIGEFFGGWLVKRKLDRMFKYRHCTLSEYFPYVDGLGCPVC